LVLLISCNNATNQKTDDVPQARVETFKVADGWAYSIYLGNKEYIRQTSIPSIQGNIPFSTDSQATVAGNLVLSKLKAHHSPSISRKELEDYHLLPAKGVNTNNNQIQSSTNNASLSQ
jgi:hypothetical protein